MRVGDAYWQLSPGIGYSLFFGFGDRPEKEGKFEPNSADMLIAEGEGLGSFDENT